MPSKNAILMGLALADLQAAATRFKVAVQDRRRKDSLVTGLLSDKAMAFSQLLRAMPAASLQGLCEKLTLAPVGRGKAAAVEALDASVPARKQARASAPAKKAGAKKTTAKAAPAAKASKPGPKAKTKAAEAASQVAPQAAAASTPKKAGSKAVAKTAQPAAKATKPAAQGAKKAPRKPTSESVAPVQAPSAAPEDAPEPVETPVVAAAPAAQPVKKAPTARRGPLSWSEAAQMAEHRGQSAASMLRAPAPQATGSHNHACTKCKGVVTLQACQVQACNNYYVAEPGRKICAECLFERNTISMDDFNDRLQEERRCPHCSAPLTHLASGSHA